MRGKSLSSGFHFQLHVYYCLHFRSSCCKGYIERKVTNQGPSKTRCLACTRYKKNRERIWRSKQHKIQQVKKKRFQHTNVLKRNRRLKWKVKEVILSKHFLTFDL